MIICMYGIRVAQKNLFSEKLTSPGEFVFLLGQKSRKKQNKEKFQIFLAPYAPLENYIAGV